MIIGILPPYILTFKKNARLLAQKVMRPINAPRLNKLENDVFTRTELPVQKCAGSFCISAGFKEAIKNVDIHSLDILAIPKYKKVVIEKAPQLAKYINEFSKEFPNFFEVFRPKTNEPDLGKHVLATFQELIEHPGYKRSSKRMQNNLEIAALRHDEGKTKDSGVGHTKISVRMIRKSLEKTSMTKEDKDLILKLIQHHHYSENIVKKRMTYEDYAKIFTEEEFEMLKILIDADLKSKTKNVQYRMDENLIFFAEQAKAFQSLKKKEETLTLAVHIPDNKHFKRFVTSTAASFSNPFII